MLYLTKQTASYSGDKQSRFFIKVTTLLLGILIVFTTMMANTVYAQDIEQSELRIYNLPAGNLEESLNDFASQGGISLSINPELVKGLRAPELKGAFTTEEGLNALLEYS